MWRCATALAGLTLLVAPALSAATGLAARTLLLDAALAGETVLAVGERGTILRSSDGRTWSEAASTTVATLTGVSFASAKVGWAVGHDALILVTTDGGTTWSKQWQGENLTDSFLDVLAVTEEHAIAVGAYGLFAETHDGGKTWGRRSVIQDDYHLNRISRGPSGTLYIAGEHGTVLRSPDSGFTWEAIPTEYDGSFYGVLPLGSQSLLAHGLRGRVFRTDNDGIDWAPVSTNETALLATGVRLSNGGVVLAGQARALLASRDARESFVRREVGVSTGIAELLELPNGSLLAVGEAGATIIDVAGLIAADPQKAP